MATVLVTALAATIALVAVRQTVMVTRAESVRTDFSRAWQQAEVVQAEFERQLRDDPQFYYRKVFAWERPRRCATPPATPTSVFYDTTAPDKQMRPEFPWALPPLDPRDPTAGTADKAHAGDWPSTCGPTWTYLGAGKQLAGFTHQTVRAEITPPSATSAATTLKVVAQYGSSEAALIATYRAPAVSRYTFYTGSDLRLDDLFHTQGSVRSLTAQGTVYVDGRTWMPSLGAQGATLAGLTLLSERGIVGDAGTSSARLYTGVPSEQSATLLNLRAAVPAEQTPGELEAAADRLPALGCQGVGAAQLVNFASGPYAGRTNQLCLSAGGPALPAGSSTPITFPATVAAWMLLPDGPQVRVYAATTLPKAPGDCLIVCSPASLGASSVKHPGQLPAADVDRPAGQQPTGVWSFQGKFNIPASGVIAADADVYFSRCDRFTETRTSCGPDTFGPSSVPSGGVRTTTGFTVIAGTSADPADVWIQGPVTAADDTAPARVGLVATGQVKFPYWSHPVGADLTVRLSALALGLGADRGEAPLGGYPELTAAPLGTDAASSTADPSVGGRLVVQGSLAATSFGAPIAGFRQTQVVPDPALVSDAPPQYPGFDTAPARQSSQRVSPTLVCGSAAPSGTCTGYW